jgi:hypothetical protein
MWFLVVIILSQPYTVSGIEVIGKYNKMNVCEKEKARALDIGLPYAHSSIGCLKIRFGLLSSTISL